MYTLQDWAAVQKVYGQTKSKRKTAKILNMSRNTVRRLLELTEEPVYRRLVRKSILDDYKEQIIIWRCKPFEFNGTRIFRELMKIGYEGSIGPVYRFLRIIDEDTELISSKATERVETPPGDQAQFDWTEYQITVNGRKRTVYCFAMILAASRKKAVVFSLKQDADAIYEAIQELFEDLGGVTLELLIDNPKALVIDNDPKSEEEIRYNPHALLLAKHLGTELNACPYYWPRKKGKIESPFKYIEEQFVKGNEFATMEELNRRGKRFVDAWCDETHTTTRRIPNQHYLLEEKQTLQPLPKERLRFKKLQPRVVSSDSLVSINANKYSVPVKYAGKTVQYRTVYGFRIEIYDRKENLILTLEKADGKHNVKMNKEHYADIAKPFSTSIPQIRRDFTERFRNGKRYLDTADRKFDQPTHHARKILLLTELFDDETLDQIIGLSIERDRMDINSFRMLLREHVTVELGAVEEAVLQQAGSELRTATNDYRDDDPNLTRDCGYYENYAMTEATHHDTATL